MGVRCRPLLRPEGDGLRPGCGVLAGGPMGRFNADLANDLGTCQPLAPLVGALSGRDPDGVLDPDIAASVEAAARLSTERVDAFDFRGAWKRSGRVDRQAVKYLDTRAPWTSCGRRTYSRQDCLLTTCEAIRRLSVSLISFIPTPPWRSEASSASIRSCRVASRRSSQGMRAWLVSRSRGASRSSLGSRSPRSNPRPARHRRSRPRSQRSRRLR